MRLLSFVAAAAVVLVLPAFVFTPARAAGMPTAEDFAVPRYRHVFVIMGENKNRERIIGSQYAPRLTQLAQTYGDASNFFGEVHPSQANYVALVGGSTYGIHDDDAYYCAAGSTDANCPGAKTPGYVPHTIDAPNLGTQLEAAGLTWKNYNESIPAPGSLAVTGSNPVEDGPNAPPYYAVKHSGFMNFASVQKDPRRAEKIVGYDQLRRDLAANALPSFGLIIPNLCNDMHGMAGPNVPDDCLYAHVFDATVRRGDAAMTKVVEMIQSSAAWKSNDNVAIVITWDENDGLTREGCCGVTPNAPSNFGGGHIAAIVVTNHGPHGAVDPMPYNHYSLLRTIEDAFGIRDYLGLAAATDQGVRPMLPLFRVSR
ncbi:MAG: phosphoesterase [Candidatus Eremiobacteraeota bacterium]|nr:phosphoesterase [Candidatus Eremiobacteraeota bacterium]